MSYFCKKNLILKKNIYMKGQQTTDNRQQTLGMLLGSELCSVPEPVECILFVTSTSSVTDIFLSQRRKGTQRYFN